MSAGNAERNENRVAIPPAATACATTPFDSSPISGADAVNVRLTTRKATTASRANGEFFVDSYQESASSSRAHCCGARKGVPAARPAKPPDLRGYAPWVLRLSGISACAALPRARHLTLEVVRVAPMRGEGGGGKEGARREGEPTVFAGPLPARRSRPRT